MTLEKLSKYGRFQKKGEEFEGGSPGNQRGWPRNSRKLHETECEKP